MTWQPINTGKTTFKVRLNMQLSIIIPCYNEAKNIPLILEKCAAAFKDQSVEVVLVNNGSTDDSASVFEHQLKHSAYPFARVVTVEKNIGYGHGIMTGLRSANGEVLAWTHADLQTDPADVLKAYQTLLSVPELSQAVIKGRRVGRQLGDWLFTLGMSVMASIVLGKLLYDINAQPKLFHRSFLTKLIAAPDDFSLDLYLLYVAKLQGLQIVTIPVHFGQRIHGESKWAFSFRSRWKTVARTIKYIFALRSQL